MKLGHFFGLNGRTWPILLAVAALAGAHPERTAAQSVAPYPSKPIKLVVPFPPGGGTDASARLIASKMQEKLGQTILIDNRAGANGNIGMEAVYRADPDGYTLLFGSPGPLSISKLLYTKLSFDPDAFVPVSVIAAGPGVLVVHPKVQAHSMRELIEYAKANPDRINYASQGMGSVAHLTAETFKAMTGTRMVHIAYKGSAPALQDVLAGQVEMMFAELSTALPGIRNGSLRALSVGSEKRTELLPGVPAFSETVPGFVAVNWQALVAPPKTPVAIAEKLSATIAEVLKQPDVVTRLNQLSLEGIGSTPAETAVFLKRESERWGKVVRQTNTTVE
jgi:tripartite-type tricarboxylate transporter receptor subunit TctC